MIPIGITDKHLHLLTLLLVFLSKWGIGLKTIRMSTNKEMHVWGLGRMEENFLTIPTILQHYRQTAESAAQYFEKGLPGLCYKTSSALIQTPPKIESIRPNLKYFFL